MNKEVLDLGNVGYGAITDEEWFYAFDKIISSTEKQKELSENAYKVVMENYDINVVAELVNRSLKNI